MHHSRKFVSEFLRKLFIRCCWNCLQATLSCPNPDLMGFPFERRLLWPLLPHHFIWMYVHIWLAGCKFKNAVSVLQSLHSPRQLRSRQQRSFSYLLVLLFKTVLASCKWCSYFDNSAKLFCAWQVLAVHRIRGAEVRLFVTEDGMGKSCSDAVSVSRFSFIWTPWWGSAVFLSS